MEVTNRFKALDLIECLKNYRQRFGTLYKRKGTRPSPRNRNAKGHFCLRRLSEEALQTAMKRREVKGKGEKERSIVVNYSKLEGDRPVSLSGGSLWLG